MAFTDTGPTGVSATGRGVTAGATAAGDQSHRMNTITPVPWAGVFCYLSCHSGFENWQALKAGVATMASPAAKTSTGPVLTAAEPQLFVSDIAAACDFF